MVVVEPVRMQPDRPASVEVPACTPAAAQRIGSGIHPCGVVADRIVEGPEQRTDDRVAAARQIRGGLRAVAQ